MVTITHDLFGRDLGGPCPFFLVLVFANIPLGCSCHIDYGLPSLVFLLQQVATLLAVMILNLMVLILFFLCL
jgi:hypothetical protein